MNWSAATISEREYSFFHIDSRASSSFNNGDETFDTIEDRSIFEIKKGQGDETTRGTPPDEYDEGKEVFGPDGTVDDIDEIDDRIIKEIEDEIN